MREIALDSRGNLYATQFRGAVQMIANADNAAKVTSNSSVDWYEPFAINSFTGLDIAVGVRLLHGELEGDFNKNGERDPMDLDLLADGMSANDLAFDLNGDGQTDLGDREFWIVNLTNTFYGDSDFNGEFNSSDFVTVFESARYENGEVADWTEGDWNGDRVFNSGDFVISFQGTGYESGPREGGLQVVPEPSSSPLMLLAVFGLTTASCKFRVFDST